MKTLERYQIYDVNEIPVRITFIFKNVYYPIIFNVDTDCLEETNNDYLCIGVDSALEYFSKIVDDESYLKIEEAFLKISL